MDASYHTLTSVVHLKCLSGLMITSSWENWRTHKKPVLVCLWYKNVYSYLSIYLSIYLSLYTDVCVVGGRQSQRDFYFQHLWTTSDCLECLRLSLFFFFPKTTQRAVPSWSCDTGSEGQQEPRTLVSWGEDVMPSIQAQDTGPGSGIGAEKGVEQSAGSMKTVKAIAKLRPGSERRDESVSLVAVLYFRWCHRSCLHTLYCPKVRVYSILPYSLYFLLVF